MLSLCSCAAQDYKLATRLAKEGDYERAISFFENARKYKDSQEKTKECKYIVAKGYMENEDYENAILYLTDLNYNDSEELLRNCHMKLSGDIKFLDDLKKLLTFRLHEAAYNDVDDKSLYATEYDLLRAYDLYVFYDYDLKQIASNIIKGLKGCCDSYSNSILREAQAQMYESQYLLSSSYTKLYESYDFMTDDSEFKKQYVDALDSNKTMAEGSQMIKADLDEQSKLLSNTGTPWTKDGKVVSWTVTNNTKYTYTLKVFVTYYDEEGTSYYTDQAQAKLAPGGSQEFKFTINSELFAKLTYDYLYQDIF